MRLKEKLLAPGENGGGYLVKLRGGQNEHQVFRGFLQDLQQGVEGGGGEHMHLVDDIHALFHRWRGRRPPRPAGRAPDPLRCWRRRPAPARPEWSRPQCRRQAGHWLQGLPSTGCSAVDRPGEDLGAGGLAGAPGAGEKVGVGQTGGGYLAFCRVSVIWLWPATSSKVLGRHLR